MQTSRLALLLALLLCLSLTACGTAQESGSADPQQDSAAPEAATQDPTAEASPEEPGELSLEEDTLQVPEDPPAGPSYQITHQDYTLYTNSQGQVGDYVLIAVENTGSSNLWIQDAFLTFEDQEGNPVASQSDSPSIDPALIAPGEEGYVYVNMGSVDGTLEIDGDYTLVPELLAVETQEEIVRYEVTDTALSAGSSGPLAVTGNVTNTTDQDESSVWVATVFFDENDAPLCAAGVKVMDLAAGSTQAFSLDAMLLADLDVSLDDVARYEVYACKP